MGDKKRTRRLMKVLDDRHRRLVILDGIFGLLLVVGIGVLATLYMPWNRGAPAGDLPAINPLERRLDDVEQRVHSLEAEPSQGARDSNER